MIDIETLRSNSDEIKETCQKRNCPLDIDKIIELDKESRNLLQEIEQLRRERNQLTAENRTRGVEIKESLKAKEPKYNEVSLELKGLLEQIPNLIHPDTPIATDESGNKVIKTHGDKPSFDFEVKDHLALGELLDVIDVETAGKITGSRFSYLKNELALMEFALVNHIMKMLSSEDEVRKIAETVHTGYSAKPFTPMVPPVLIRPEVFRKAGRLTDADKDERYHIASDDLYLIGSAEHTLSPYYMDHTFNESDLPVRFVGFSTAFRREAGSYGKDVRGILRVHQFDKLELESFTLPEDGEKEQDMIVAIQEKILQDLGLPYQVVLIASGDMSNCDYRQIDIETWMPAQNQYRETHTSDYVTDYQARSLGTKVKRNDGSKEYVHMNDATAVAIGRIMIAILENNQQEDGSVRIPEMLIDAVGKSVITPR